MFLKTPVDVSAWSNEELARAITIRAHVYGSAQLNNPRLSDEEETEIFLRTFGKASCDYGFISYFALSVGVRKLIGEPGGRGRAQMQREIDTVGPAVDFDEAPPSSKPKSVPFPLTQTPWFRRKALRHSWWYLEMEG